MLSSSAPTRHNPASAGRPDVDIRLRKVELWGPGVISRVSLSIPDRVTSPAPAHPTHTQPPPLRAWRTRPKPCPGFGRRSQHVDTPPHTRTPSQKYPAARKGPKTAAPRAPTARARPTPARIAAPTTHLTQGDPRRGPSPAVRRPQARPQHIPLPASPAPPDADVPVRRSAFSPPARALLTGSWGARRRGVKSGLVAAWRGRHPA